MSSDAADWKFLGVMHRKSIEQSKRDKTKTNHRGTDPKKCPACRRLKESK